MVSSVLLAHSRGSTGNQGWASGAAGAGGNPCAWLRLQKLQILGFSEDFSHHLAQEFPAQSQSVLFQMFPVSLEDLLAAHLSQDVLILSHGGPSCPPAGAVCQERGVCPAPQPSPIRKTQGLEPLQSCSVTLPSTFQQRKRGVEVLKKSLLVPFHSWWLFMLAR